MKIIHYLILINNINFIYNNVFNKGVCGIPWYTENDRITWNEAIKREFVFDCLEGCDGFVGDF